MGLLDFKYQKRIANKEQLSEKIAEALRDNGVSVGENNGEITATGLKSYFNVGSATIKVDDAVVSVEGSVKPSVAAMVTGAICIVLLCIFLFTNIDSFDTMLGVIVSGIFGVSGLIGSIITFFVGKELMRQNIALLVSSVEN